MSGSDIRDILQLGKPSSDAANLRRLSKPAERRPDGISRELYSLIGGAPPAALVRPTYKAKFNVKKKATPWQVNSQIIERFTNNARNDDLALEHWIKASDANKPEYPFAHSGKGLSVIEYSDEEYADYLEELDPDWTKEETDYLMELCRQFDLRFVIIADRYQFGNSKRSVEDLKDRYCRLQRALIKLRTGSEAQAQQYAFDKARETERKEALDALHRRTREQMEEEEALLVEVRRIEQDEARLARERESVMHVQPVSSRANAGSTSNNGTTPEPKVKRRRRLTAEDKRRPATEDVAGKEKLIAGVHVQSQRLPLVKPSIHAKTLKVLDEVAVGPRPVMPTAAVCHAFDQLRASVSAMFELKKVVDKMEIEHRIHQKSRESSRRCDGAEKDKA
ncbi:hypothetical protein BJV82DRAFT_665062 [Fennellomyces sp. T-0311]|nr:hypothetical protein BJV82DRAFT_665062 [Fennellomyces sp. T-0311]